jgi:large-conductance mechanosensitive channel
VIFLIIKTINYLHHQPLTNLTKLNAQEKLLTEIRDLLQTNALTEPLMQMPTVTHQ